MRSLTVVLSLVLLHYTSGCSKPQPGAVPKSADQNPATEGPKVEQTGSVATHRSSAGVPDADGWYPAASTQGGFSVRLPARFDDLTLPTNAGLIYIIGTVRPDGTQFTATAIRPIDHGAAIAEVYQRADAAQAGGQAKRLELFGLKGTEYIGTCAGVGTGMVRTLYSDSTVYTLIVEYRQGPTLPPDVERDGRIFIESFRLK